ncbi:serine protease [Citreicoccus inhibens]|uniref:serine protease n=1 Tax=Citreicoccus inhibens TaxID=2849499 RepID=UPI001EF150A0|nr:serine protease [Citreicoccus inhibens]
MRFVSGWIVAVGLLGCGGTGLEQEPVAEVASQGQPIVGGVEARPNSFPWMISLQSNGIHFCGGSLLRVGAKEQSDIVVTAAHCIADGSTGLVAVAGAHDLEKPSSTQISVRVTRAIPHPQYNPDTTLNDIAILKLEKPIKFVGLPTGTSACGLSSGIRPAPATTPGLVVGPICLPASGEIVPEGTLMTTAGWGLVREGGFSTSPILMQVEVPVVNDATLRANYSNQGISIDKAAMFGAGYARGGQDSCQGDSGGPLIVKAGSKYVLQGITSFGVGCARAGLPGVYARVSHYIPWLKQQIPLYSTSL